MMEQFCREFLLNHPDYRHVYDILDTYNDKFQQIDVASLFSDRETFIEVFPSICFTVAHARRFDQPTIAVGSGVSRAYVLTILGFAVHVHRHCQNLEWYDIDIMLSVLVDILTHLNFNPSDFCKYSFCYII